VLDGTNHFGAVLPGKDSEHVSGGADEGGAGGAGEEAGGLDLVAAFVEGGLGGEVASGAVGVARDGGPGEGKPVFVNGTSTPDAMAIVVGSTYRLRFTVISANEGFLSTMSGPGGAVSWRLLANDGHDVSSSAQSTDRPARYVAGPGKTSDFSFTPATPGDYALVVGRAAGGGTVTKGPTTTVPIRVRAAASPSPSPP
jgi:hypothetical protein